MQFRDAYAYRDEPEQSRMLFEWSWRALLFMTIVLCMCAIALGAFVFLKTSNVPDAGHKVALSQPVLDRERLTHILNAFAQRGTQYEYLKTAPPIADPSK